MNLVQSKTNETASDGMSATVPTVAKRIASINQMGALIWQGLTDGNILMLTKENKREMVNTIPAHVLEFNINIEYSHSFTSIPLMVRNLQWCSSGMDLSNGIFLPGLRDGRPRHSWRINGVHWWNGTRSTVLEPLRPI
jgi:hypothetical protein